MASENGFLLEKVKGQRVRCRFCGSADSHGHLFWECVLFHLPLRFVNIREFHDLMEMDKSPWPRCLLWHGWLPLLSWGEWDSLLGLGGPREGAANLVECALGRYSSDALREWQLPVGFDGVAAAKRVAAVPDVWTDGSLVDDKVSGACSAGAGCFTYRIVVVFGRIVGGAIWMMMSGWMPVVSACRGFCSVPGRLQSVQRAEFWGVILALQANDGVHLGVDNLGVVRCVGRLLDGKTASRPAELVQDGDLILLIEMLLRLRGWTRFVSLRLRVMLMRPWFGAGWARDLDRLGT